MNKSSDIHTYKELTNNLHKDWQILDFHVEFDGIYPLILIKFNLSSSKILLSFMNFVMFFFHRVEKKFPTHFKSMEKLWNNVTKWLYFREIIMFHCNTQRNYLKIHINSENVTLHKKIIQETQPNFDVLKNNISLLNLMR